MSKLTRITQRIFGSGAGLDQVAQFGSLFAGAPAFTTDPATAMSLSNWLTGWFAAAIGGNAPAIEDMNAAMFAITYQIAQSFQDGIPEWDAGTTYFIGGFVSSGKLFYVSLVDNNLNNLVTDVTKWKLIGGDILTALGDMIYADANGGPVVLSGNTTTAKAMLVQTGAGGGVSAAPVWDEIKAPTFQRFTSGSGTYTLPTSPRKPTYIKIRALGGGAGGQTANGTGSNNGGATTFTGVCSAGGGGAAVGTNGGGTSGTNTISSGTTLVDASGGMGESTGSISNFSGGHGGSSYYGGSAKGGIINVPGSSAPANAGGGGGGGGGASTVSGGGGGGAGGYVEVIIYNPANTYTYSVGGGGAGGNSGTGQAGGAGGSGVLVVEEYYQ